MSLLNKIRRFEEKYVPVTESGCWIWIASDDYRYGLFYTGESSSKMEKAHRVSYKLYKGKIPNGLHVLHRCDNTFCVNPDHLFLGTHKDNMRDMVKKGRNKSEQKYSNEIIEDIIKNLTPKEAKNKYGIDSGYASRIKRGITSR